jgi:hypothetical protein
MIDASIKKSASSAKSLLKKSAIQVQKGNPVVTDTMISKQMQRVKDRI